MLSIPAFGRRVIMRCDIKDYSVCIKDNKNLATSHYNYIVNLTHGKNCELSGKLLY